MTQVNALDFPEDIGLALAIARRFVEWLAAEKARTGMTEEQIIAKYDATFDANDKQMGDFLEKLKSEAAVDELKKEAKK